MAFFDERLNLDVAPATNLREQSWLGHCCTLWASPPPSRTSCIQCDPMAVMSGYTDGAALKPVAAMVFEHREDSTLPVPLTYLSSFSPRSLRSHNIFSTLPRTFLVTEQNVLDFPPNKLSNLRKCVNHDGYDDHRSRTTTPLPHSFLHLRGHDLYTMYADSGDRRREC